MSDKELNSTLDTPFDRGEVKNQKGRNIKGNIFLLIFPLVAILIFMVVMAFNIFKGQSNSPKKKPVDDRALLSNTDDRASTTSLTAAQKTIRQQMDERDKKLEAIKEKEQAKIQTQQPVVIQNNNASGEKKITPLERKQQDNVLMAFDGGSNANKADNNQPTNRPRGIGNQSNASSNSFNSELQGSDFANGFAFVRKNLDYLLIHGTNIPCVLKTKVITNYKSIPLCIVSRDIYSANGKVLLIEKGSLIAGEQRSAMTQGKSRVFISWSTIETPYGVSLTIDSLGTDTLGASGADAWVDNHYKERFGAAILLTLLDGVIQYAENKASESSSDDRGFTFNNNTNTSDIASKALENSINIEPTGYINQGTLLNVLVARDIDMQSIYTVR